jgi:hypothetical protein
MYIIPVTISIRPATVVTRIVSFRTLLMRMSEMKGVAKIRLPVTAVLEDNCIAFIHRT